MKSYIPNPGYGIQLLTQTGPNHITNSFAGVDIFQLDFLAGVSLGVLAQYHNRAWSHHPHASGCF